MLETKDNFPNNFSEDMCPLCENIGEKHLMRCQSLKSKSIVKTSVIYEDIFTNEVSKQHEVASIIFENLKRRKELLKERKEDLTKFY